METRLGTRAWKSEEVLQGSGADADVRDHCNLEVLNDATLLHATCTRFGKDKIYTYISEILLAVNPFKPLPHLYDADAKASPRSRCSPFPCHHRLPPTVPYIQRSFV